MAAAPLEADRAATGAHNRRMPAGRDHRGRRMSADLRAGQTARRKLPIGIQTFREVREDACLLRGQDGLRAATGGRGQALLPVAPAPLRQEPVPRHPQGSVRGQGSAVRRARHPRQVGLVDTPPRAAPELRQRQLQGVGLSAHEPDGAACRHRATGGGRLRPHERAGAFRRPDRGAARARRMADGRPGRRVRQADPGRPRRAGNGLRQPRLPSRAVRDHQGPRRAHQAHLPDRRKQVLQR